MGVKFTIQEPPAVWICPCCGRMANARRDFVDAACRTHAVLCWVESIMRGPDGRVIEATACGWALD